MIKILKYGEIAAEEIFSRAEGATNVEEIVADIIYNVRKHNRRKQDARPRRIWQKDLHGKIPEKKLLQNRRQKRIVKNGKKQTVSQINVRCLFAE